MQVTIASPANPKIKWLASLHKARQRQAEQLIVVEGAKEVTAALAAGITPHSFFIAPELSTFHPSSEAPLFAISKSAFAKVAYRDNSDGVIGVFRIPQLSLDELTLSKNPFLFVLEAIEKPGNLGAIIRTADAVGADAVIICNGHTDIWNSNAIRASVGTIFTVPVVSASSNAVHEFLTKHGITPFAAALTPSALSYTEADYRKGSALLLGTEADGLSDFWLQHATAITIPMKGKNDSLNVSVAAGVLAYEVVRQRK